MRSLFAALMVLCFACNTPEKPVLEQEVPKALQEKDSYDLFSKRGSGDIIDKLFAELIEKDSALKSIESQMNSLGEGTSDSLTSFLKFNANNRYYYDAANKSISGITDSTAKHEMELLLKNSFEKYELKIAAHNALQEEINKKTTMLRNQYIMLQIIRTLPLIEKYQDNNAPLKTPIEGLLKKLDKTSQDMEKLLKEK